MTVSVRYHLGEPHETIGAIAMSTRYIKVSTSHLRLGMFVTDLDRPWLDTPFPIQGFLLEDKDDLRTLERFCQHVYIDPLRSTVDLTSRMALVIPSNIKLTTYVDKAPVEEELPRAREAYVRTKEVIQELICDIQTDSDLHIEHVDAVVNHIVDSVISNPDALMWVALLRGAHNNVYTHGIRVSVYLLVFGRYLGFPISELHNLGMIGLLLDIGKTKTPRELLSKNGKLTAEEFEEVMRHVQHGVEILSGFTTIHPEVLNGIAQHHERFNGRGYPKGLFGDDIGISGQMAGIADCFAALTSHRPYGNTISPSDALLQLYSGDYFHRPLVEQFVQAIGAFPAGTLVELSSGEVAVVVRHNRVRRLQPNVLLVTDANKQLLERPVAIDLMNQYPLGRREPLRIRCGLPADAYGIDTSAYYIGRSPVEAPRSLLPDAAA